MGRPAQAKKTAGVDQQTPNTQSRLTGRSWGLNASLLALEPRLMFDAAAAATAADLAPEQVAKQQADAAMSADAAHDAPHTSASAPDPLLDAISTYDPPAIQRREVVFVDTSVEDYEALLADVNPNATVVLLDSSRNGIQQIADYLANRQNVDAIHIVSHGSEGALQLGTAALDAESMRNQYAALLTEIGSHLSEASDILVYGCEFGKGDAGQEAVMRLSSLTGADVSASEDLTGAAELGGNWKLEVTIGQIETAVVFGEQVQSDFDHLLAAPAVDLNGGAAGTTVTTAFTEQTPVAIAPAATLTDADGDNLNRLRVTLTARPDGDTVESLSLNGAATTAASGAGLAVSYTASSGVLSITGLATAAVYQSILQGVQYNDTSDQPTTSNRSITVVARDSTSANSTSQTATITVTAVNDAPVVDLNGGGAGQDVTTAFTEQTPVAIAPVGTLTDVDSANLTALTVTLTARPDGDTVESLSLNGAATTAASGAGLAVSYTAGTGVLSITGSATAAVYQSILQGVQYNDTSDQPTTSNRSITVVTNDGTTVSTSRTATLTVTAANDAPIAADDRLALNFDGIDDFVQVGSNPVFEVTNQVTMEAWINPDASTNVRQIIINREGEYEVALDPNGHIQWALANTDPGWNWHDTGVVVPLHTWSHIAISYNNGVVTTYLNGVAAEVYNGSGAIGDAYAALDELRIGGRSNNPANQYFDGRINEAQVWNVARTGGEILSDMTGALTGSEAGLLGFWRFNENTGGTANNLVAANDDGTLGGGVGGQSPAWTGYRINEDSALNVGAPGILSNDFDADGNPLTAALVTGPSSAASFTLNPDGSFTYVPLANFAGNDSFTYRVNDGTVNSNIATVTIQVDPVNDAPVAVADAATVAEGGTVTGLTGGATSLLANDSDVDLPGDPLTALLVTGPTNGSLTLNANGTFSYTHNGGESTSDSFTYKVNDGTVDGNTVTVTLTVSPVNDAPVAGNNVMTISEGGTVVLGGADLSASDVDNAAETLTFTVGNVTNGQFELVSAPGGAITSFTQAQVTGGQVQFVHNGGEVTPGYEVTVDDGGLTDGPYAAAITFTNVNDNPVVATNAGSTVAEGGTDSITNVELLVIDSDNTPLQLTYTVTTGPSNGQLELTTAPGVAVTSFTQADINAGLLVYVHNGSQTTSDGFTFTVSDGAGGSLGATAFNMTVTPVNNPPTITSASAFNIAENTTAVGTVTSSDLDGGPPTYSIVGGADAARFTINAANGDLAFVTAPDFEAPADANGDNVYLVQVQVADGNGGTAVQTVAVSVTDVLEGAITPPVGPPPSGGPPGGGGPPAGPPLPAPPSGPPTASSVPAEVGSPMYLDQEPGPVRPALQVGKTVDREPPVVAKQELQVPFFDKLGPELLAQIGEEAQRVVEAIKDTYIPAQLGTAIVKELNTMTEALQRAMDERKAQATLTATAASGVSLVLSAGYLAWMLRGGWLLASLLATMPTWHHFDPLPVVRAGRRHEKNQGESGPDRDPDERLSKNVDDMFGSGRA